MTDHTNDLPPLPEDMLAQLDQDLKILVLVSGTLANGEAHYAYASIPFSKYQPFKEAEKQGNYDLTQFGSILAHGAGKTPPEDVQKRMEAEHGANHTFEDELMDLLRSLPQATNSNS